jgi:hypothetical protein
MKEYLRQLTQAAPNALVARHVMREYLQARILSSLQRAGAMIPLAFHGGTALRFLYGIPRYSEDLDFALEGRAGGYDLRGYLRAVRSDLAVETYPIEITLNDRGVVHSGLIRFRGLPAELGLPAQRDEVLLIKIEVDTRPPAGAGLEVTVVRRHVLLRLQHHDRSSLLSGKLHALLQRPYTKGRDLYDLLWYLATPDWPPPNLTMLNNALTQTNWPGETLSDANWRGIVWQRLKQLDWPAVVADVRPFLMDANEVALLTRDNFARLLGQET